MVGLMATWCWSWNSNTLSISCKELTHWKRPWCWEVLGAGGEGDDTGWDGSMASLTRWTWVWVNSGSWWWTGRPGMLRFMGLQRVGHDQGTEKQTNKEPATFFKRTYVNIPQLPGLLLSVPRTQRRLLPTQISIGEAYTLTGKSDSVFCGVIVLSPESQCTQDFFCALQESLFPPVLWKFRTQISWSSKSDSLGIPSPFTLCPGWEVWCGTYNLHNSMRTSLV